MPNFKQVDKDYRRLVSSKEPLIVNIQALFYTKGYDRIPDLDEHKGLIEDSISYFKKNDGLLGGGLIHDNPKYYLGMLAYISKYGKKLTKETAMTAACLIKTKKDAYEQTNPIARFFSYLNPFKNRYRDMRNEISEAKNFLIEKGIDKDRIDSVINESDAYIAGTKAISSRAAGEEATTMSFDEVVNEVDGFVNLGNGEKDPEAYKILQVLHENVMQQIELGTFRNNDESIEADFRKLPNAKDSIDGIEQIPQREDFYKKNISIDDIEFDNDIVIDEKGEDDLEDVNELDDEKWQAL